MDPYESICRECQITSSAEEILNEAIAAAKSGISESSKKKSPAEGDFRISQRSAKKSCSGVDTTAGLGTSNTNVKEFNASNDKNLSEIDLGFFERMKFHLARSKLPDLLSLKDSGVLSERELCYFVRIEQFIYEGVLPNIGFGDLSLSRNKRNFGKSSAPEASSNLDAEDLGNDGAGLGFSERVMEKHQISKGKSRTNLESPKCTVDFSNKFTAKASEMNIQRNAGPESPRTVHMKEPFIAKGNSLLEIDLGLSKSKVASCGTSISKNKESLLEKNSISDTRSSSESILRSQKDGIKGPADEDEFARFRYCKSDKPPNYPRSTRDATSHNHRIGRKLPPSIQDPMTEKMNVSNSGTRGGGDVPSLEASFGEKAGISRSTKCSSNSASRNEVMKNLLDLMKAVTKESDRCSGDEDEDILEVAKKAGYTFPSPRWWPP